TRSKMSSKADLQTPLLPKTLQTGKEFCNLAHCNEDTKYIKWPKIFSIILNITLSIVLIVIGGVYKEECPVQPMIPIWCIVHGSLSLISLFLEFVIILRGDGQGKIVILVRLIHAWLPILFIIGCIYTYSNYQPQYVAPKREVITYRPSEYCNKVVYQFTFWYITTYFIIMAAVFIFSTCCCCCIIIGGLLTKSGQSTNSKMNVENETSVKIETTQTEEYGTFQSNPQA
ncbi:unnamed protein product, partial [Meganyctiphanes norvegica]